MGLDRGINTFRGDRLAEYVPPVPDHEIQVRDTSEAEHTSSKLTFIGLDSPKCAEDMDITQRTAE